MKQLEGVTLRTAKQILLTLIAAVLIYIGGFYQNVPFSTFTKEY